MPKHSDMLRDDAECLRLGREIVRMIRELRDVSQGETGYTRRTVSFPGGEVCIFITGDQNLARLFDDAADKGYDVKTVTPSSGTN